MMPARAATTGLTFFEVVRKSPKDHHRISAIAKCSSGVQPLRDSAAAPHLARTKDSLSSLGRDPMVRICSPYHTTDPTSASSYPVSSRTSRAAAASGVSPSSIRPPSVTQSSRSEPAGPACESTLSAILIRRCRIPRADPAAETWVRRHARALLSGDLDEVIADLTSSAAGREQTKRTGIDKAIGYLTRHRSRLDYPTALTRGWPIATGVIEGACRHIVADRLDITGARWGLAGAEAVLKLRAVNSNGDFAAYWSWHLDQEHQRIHRSRFKNGAVPRA